MTENIVVVPDLAAVDLTALLPRNFGLEGSYTGLRSWDYYTDLDGKSIPGRGRSFESMVWNPKLKTGERIASEAVRQFFRDLGYEGHTGAFVQWLRMSESEGYHASIPEDGACYRSSDGSLFAPCEYFDDYGLDIGLHPIDRGLESWSFVGFKLID